MIAPKTSTLASLQPHRQPIEIRRLVRSAFSCILAIGAGCLLVGCYTINRTDCIVADTKSNRIAVSNVVTSVTREHGFKPNPRRLNSSVLVAAYAPSPGASQKQINLTASIYQNRITAGLAQIKVGRRRTSYYLEIQNDLIQRFKSEFGGNVEIKVYDEEMPP